MSCLEKRHASHRTGSMLHHRFPNGFTDLFMDETDREVSTLTDRAFRSLCVGDDAVYNDDFLYGYSPYSCLKPLAGEPLKKKYPKESKKEEPHKPDKGDSQSWKQQQQQSISHMSSFLKVFSAAEESCEGMMIRNGDTADSNGESWDQSALRSIEKELSEFSSDCHTSLQDGHRENQPPHQSGNGSANKKGKDVNHSSGKFTRIKHGKSTVKLRKLNVKNFFLHSELSPFQTWTDCNRFPFAQENTVGNILSTDNISKWYDLPFYKKLTEAHRKETLRSDEAQTSHKEVDPSDTKVSKPNPAPPIVLPKPSAPLTEKRCSSDGGDGHAAPWRRNKSRAKSTVPINQVGIPPQESNSKATDESISLPKKEIKSVEVKAVEDDSPVASTPFSICQLMTPVIPSRQPTDTSEVLQAVLSPSAFDLLGGPRSEVKGTPEPPVKRESYKSLASSILFNLKDNRKRVKSRYSPPKFRSSDGGTRSPQTDCANQAASEDGRSGSSTPDVSKAGLAVFSPPLEPIASSNVDLIKRDKTLSDDYLLSNLLQTKQDSVGNNHGEEYPVSPFVPLKKNKSPMAKKQNYPSLNLYKKASPADADVKYLQVPLSIGAPANVVPPTETKDGELPLNMRPKNTKISPKTLNAAKDFSPAISPCAEENVGQPPGRKHLPNVPDKTKRTVKNTREKYSCLQPTSKENNPDGQTSMKNVIRAARDAIHSARTKAHSASYPDNVKRQVSDTEEMKQEDTEQKVSKETFGCTGQSPETAQNAATSEMLIGKSSQMNKEPPPVPKRNFTKSGVRPSLDKQQRCNVDKLTFSPKQNEPVSKQDKQKHVFSARQNNYIKHQRCAATDDEQTKEFEKNHRNARTGKETENETTSLEEMRNSERIFNNDLQALKVRDRVRLGDRMLEFARTKLEVMKTDEETKAENELISRELRNIKKGMLSMRGNTSAKKKMFAQKEKEAFRNVDGNVIVSKALNDNYDRAKMALEEVIAERERKKAVGGSVLTFEGNDRSSETLVQEGTKDGVTELREDQDTLGDFINQNQLRQTQPRPVGGADSPDSYTVSNEQNAKSSLADNPTPNPEFSFEGRSRSNEEGRKCSMNGCVDKTIDTPLVPPRNKKGGTKRDGSVTEEKNTDGEVFENPPEQYVQTRTSSETKDAPPTQYDLLLSKEMQIDVNNANLKLNDTLSENAACLSTKLRENESKGESCQMIMCPNEGNDSQKTIKKKQKTPLKPDHLIRPDNPTKSLKQETQTDQVNNEQADTEAFCETPRNIVSPLLLLNGISIAQSPPDQGSLSSKSSYFSVESALQRNTETESNVYHSLENLALEVEKADRPGQTVLQRETDRVLVEYYSLNDHKKGLEEKMLRIKTPQKKPEDGNDTENVPTNEKTTRDETDPTVSPTTPYSPTSEIPALFKIKDNTFSNRTKKTLVPWSPRGSLNTSEMMEKKLHPAKENPEFSLVNETCAVNTVTSSETLNTGDNLSQLLSLLPSEENLQEVGVFLAVPQEEDKLSQVTPSSEDVESVTTSAAETAKAGINPGALAESERTKAPSKQPESISSGSDNQTELPKPPVILPKSEKAVLKAMKLTNRRLKKEEAQKLSQKSSQSSSKHTADRSKSDKSEQKTNSSAKAGRKSDKKHIDSTSRRETHLSHDNTQSEPLQSNKNHFHTTQRQSHDSVDHINQNRDALPERTLERQGRSGSRRLQERPKQRHYSNDRVVNTAPVSKDPADQRPTSDRSFHRSQSIDRCTVGKAEGRLSAHVSTNEKLEPRTQRIEKSIMHELQQRGRARDKESQGNPLRRSHSIDAYPTEAPLMSRQLSRQSSIEHTIVTQSFPMTQRKLLQDPDSGQYFFVDLPVQVKTKTFFDPDTGSYVQLPLQPPDGALPHASHMEVLTPPMVVYHSFVPVPLSPMARTAAIQTPQIELNDLEQKHLERVRQKHCKEGHPYLEPAYGQQDHLLGDFMSTEELDCPS